MIPFCLVVIALISYVLGSVNGAIVASRVLYHDDIRNYGSHNAGLTNFHRTYGMAGVAWVIGIDIGKTALGVLLGKFLMSFFDASDVGALFASLCLVLGHMFPVFHGMRGGKGVMCAGISMFFIDWRIGIMAAIVFFGLIAVFRYVSLGAVAVALVYPILVLLTGHGGLCATISLVIAVLVIVKHRTNISRLLNHTENKLVFKKDLSDKFGEKF